MVAATSPIKWSLKLAASPTGLSGPIAALTIQIVNDSGLSDSNVFIMVPGAATGAAITPQSLFVDKNNGTNTAVPLSDVTPIGANKSCFVRILP